MAALPQLDAESLEDLLIAVLKLKRADGLAIIVQPEEALSYELLKQIPQAVLFTSKLLRNK